MGIAIAVAVIVLVIAAAIVVAVLIVRARNKGDNIVGEKSPIRSIGAEAVHSTLSGDVPRASDVHVGDSARSTSGKTGENLTSRFLALTIFAAGVFGALGVRLFGMQVLSGSQYGNEARENRYSVVATPAPRGYIFDADGRIIVKNRTALTVMVDSEVIDNHDVVSRLSTVLGIPYNVVRSRILDASSGAQSQRVVENDARLRDVAFIAEHSDAFEGVTVQERTIRSYPYGALAAHVVGYTGPISEDELATMPENRNVELGDDVGKSGIESTYDNVLAGEHGQRTVMADSNGNVVEITSETPATRGSDVYLTIKAPVQYVAEAALADLIAPDGVIGKGTGVAGAVVVMDVRDGSVLAMASYPTYTPESFIGGISQDTWDLYSTAESYYPLLNRAISGTYPAASTYKAFTGLAALKYGFADTTKKWNCEGSWDGFGSGDIQLCWNHAGHGELDFHGGIVNSCDVVFYEIAYDFFYAGTTQGGNISDTAMQEEIAKYGFGKVTGIDLSGEETGRIPTPTWKQQHWADVPTEGIWRGGDLTNMVIGQGDVLVTPLQIAVAYGGIATGTMMKPHLLKEVRNDTGSAAVVHEKEELATPDVDPANLQVVRAALNEVASSSEQLTSAFEANGLDVTKVACKTGTGEVAGKDDYAWFVCYMPNDDPRYVAAVMVEQGGGGAAVAGPIGAQVMAAIFACENGELNDVRAVAGSTGESVEYSGSSSGRTD